MSDNINGDEELARALEASWNYFQPSHLLEAPSAAAAAGPTLAYRKTTTTRTVEKFQMPAHVQPGVDPNELCAALRRVMHNEKPVSKNVSGTGLTNPQFREISGALRRYGYTGREVDFLCRSLSYKELAAILALSVDDRKARIGEVLAARPPPTSKELISAANATLLPDKSVPGGSKDKPERVGPRVGGLASVAGIEVIEVRPPNAANSFNCSDKI